MKMEEHGVRFKMMDWRVLVIESAKVSRGQAS
jgi:hypothetical protein